MNKFSHILSENINTNFFVAAMIKYIIQTKLLHWIKRSSYVCRLRAVLAILSTDLPHKATVGSIVIWVLLVFSDWRVVHASHLLFGRWMHRQLRWNALRTWFVHPARLAGTLHTGGNELGLEGAVFELTRHFALTLSLNLLITIVHPLVLTLYHKLDLFRGEFLSLRVFLRGNGGVFDLPQIIQLLFQVDLDVSWLGILSLVRWNYVGLVVGIIHAGRILDYVGLHLGYVGWIYVLALIMGFVQLWGALGHVGRRTLTALEGFTVWSIYVEVCFCGRLLNVGHHLVPQERLCPTKRRLRLVNWLWIVSKLVKYLILLYFFNFNLILILIVISI